MKTKHEQVINVSVQIRREDHIIMKMFN